MTDAPPARYSVLTLHPDLVRGPLSGSILGRAASAGLIQVDVHDIRSWAEGRHRQVDDTPYGGGAGMVMRVDVVARAIRAVRGDDGYVVHMTPAGAPFDQRAAERLAALPHLVLLCGHYEGIDARIEREVDEEISLGDFVLTGGEIAACAVVDATARLRPGVLGNASSAVEESFADGLLEHPHYTRPRVYEGVEVPQVLLSGDHARIAEYRRQQAIALTRDRRPDLWRRWAEARGVDDGSE